MTSDRFDLRRFVTAQEGIYEQAILELRAGSKQSHWMWFIFPQFAGLGSSPTAQFFAIKSVEEAQAYLAHPTLGSGLREAVEALQPWVGKRTAEQIFGHVDAMKLRSSMTLFDHVEPNSAFRTVLTTFFSGPDERTLALLQQSR